MDLLLNDKGTRNNSLSSLFDGKWYFVVDGVQLLLVSADPDIGKKYVD